MIPERAPAQRRQVEKRGPYHTARLFQKLFTGSMLILEALCEEAVPAVQDLGPQVEMSSELRDLPPSAHTPDQDGQWPFGPAVGSVRSLDRHVCKHRRVYIHTCIWNSLLVFIYKQKLSSLLHTYTCIYMYMVTRSAAPPPAPHGLGTRPPSVVWVVVGLILPPSLHVVWGLVGDSLPSSSSSVVWGLVGGNPPPSSPLWWG